MDHYRASRVIQTEQWVLGKIWVRQIPTPSLNNKIVNTNSNSLLYSNNVTNSNSYSQCEYENYVKLNNPSKT